MAAAGKVKGIEFPEAAKAINDYPIATLTKAPAPGGGPGSSSTWCCRSRARTC